jgi:hypothetical protein
MTVEQRTRPAGPANRDGLRARLDELIQALRAGDVAALRDSLFDRRWREGLDVAAVDSGQLGYADNLIDEAHSILRRAPENTAAAIEKRERARGKLS